MQNSLTVTPVNGTPLVETRKIGKSFGASVALQEVDFAISRGEVVGLVGENGAGKSTLAKIISGVHSHDAGELYIDGSSQRLRSPRDAHLFGIALVNQETQIFPNLSVGENLLVEGLPTRPRAWIDWNRVWGESRGWLAQVGLEALDPSREAGTLSPAERQLLEVARALRTQPRLLVLDEPTTALSLEEVRNLYALVSGLRKEGTAILFISHQISDVIELCDRAVVFRDGVKVGEHAHGTATLDEVIRKMVGRSLAEALPEKRTPVSTAVLEAVGLTSSRKKLWDVSFTVCRGEIVGLTGLLGAGKTTTADIVFGVTPSESGELTFCGGKVDTRRWNPHAAVKVGLGYVTEDRKNRGLVLDAPVGRNLTMAVLDRLRHKLGGIMSRRAETAVAKEQIDALSIRPPDARRHTRNLSGGNQQKVVLGKWLARKPSMLILDEPTKGIDVGAKSEIYQLLGRFAESGGAVLICSSEVPELLRVSDRIYVLHRGRIAGEIKGEDATEERLALLMAGRPVGTGD